jgi:hypothetical protein
MMRVLGDVVCIPDRLVMQSLSDKSDSSSFIFKDTVMGNLDRGG